MQIQTPFMKRIDPSLLVIVAGVSAALHIDKPPLATSATALAAAVNIVGIVGSTAHAWWR